MSDGTTPKLQTVGVTKVFERGDGELLVLEDISVSFRHGEFVSLVGASGCGRTTLLRIIDGLIAPTAGQVLVDGQRVGRRSAQPGFVFQSETTTTRVSAPRPNSTR